MWNRERGAMGVLFTRWLYFLISPNTQGVVKGFWGGFGNAFAYMCD